MGNWVVQGVEANSIEGTGSMLVEYAHQDGKAYVDEENVTGKADETALPDWVIGPFEKRKMGKNVSGSGITLKPKNWGSRTANEAWIFPMIVP